jgi:short-subunit dehydrogenase
MGSYSATKHAVEAFSDAMRMELLPLGVAVSLVKPGSIKSAIGIKQFSSVENFSSDTEVNFKIGASRGSAETNAVYLPLVEALVNIPHAMLTKPSLEPSGTHVTDAAIVHAVTSEFPKTRYLVAIDGIMTHYLNQYFLPDRVWDA